MKLKVTIARCGSRNYIELGSPTSSEPAILRNHADDVSEVVTGEIEAPIEISDLLFHDTVFILVREAAGGAVSVEGCMQSRAAACFQMNRVVESIESELVRKKKQFRETRYRDTATISYDGTDERLHVAELRYEYLDKAA